VRALSATQVDRKKHAAIAAEERVEPDLQEPALQEPALRLGRPNVGQSDHATLRVKSINARFDHIASFQREVESKPEEGLLRN
jgi:hypothetical protein